MRRARWRSAAGTTAVVAVACAVLVGLGVPALAAGTLGDPQPELVPFSLHVYGGSGTGAVLPDGNLLLATPSKAGTTIATCLLVPGGRGCAASATLHAFGHGATQDTFDGTVEVVPTGGADVDVVALDCCNIGQDGAVEFVSTDGGRAFSGLTKAGDVASIGAATFAGGSVVVATAEQTTGLEVQALAPRATVPQTSEASPVGGEDADTALATFRGGVLVASDDTTSTHVEFAPSGSGLNTTSSYVHVATFPHELVVAASGSALLTDPHGSLTGGERLRLFNGTAFGPARAVPDSRLGDDGYFTMQETGAAVHVFFISRRTGYAVYEETTTNGVRWSPLVRYASAVFASDLEPVLGPSGAGLLEEAGGPALVAQPVRNAQSVRVALDAAKVRAGHATVLHGTAVPRLAGRVVTLEHLVGGRWDPVRTTRESAAGTFRFGVAGQTATYRAVVDELAGYDQFGYSNAVTLTAVG